MNSLLSRSKRSNSLSVQSGNSEGERNSEWIHLKSTAFTFCGAEDWEHRGEGPVQLQDQIHDSWFSTFLPRTAYSYPAVQDSSRSYRHLYIEISLDIRKLKMESTFPSNNGTCLCFYPLILKILKRSGIDGIRYKPTLV